jgi:GT2 family glycosyltransferase/glycosyltransferase involved in cell wall biosynthesis
MLKRRTVDVIVPVHDAFEELGACLRSVQQHGGDCRLILIDDGSTDERIGGLFRQLSAAKSSRVVLLRNERRLGFAATANRGIAYSRNDVVLLGSDTRVTNGWLDKIRRCAASDPGIGTVTPLSNHAGVLSSLVAAEIDAGGIDAELANRAIESAAVPLYPDIPTAVRFCMFVRRRLIRRIGVFDATLGSGRAEEYEFSIRAREAGYRNVLCDDTFVACRTSRSSGGTGLSPAKHDPGERPASQSNAVELLREFIGKDSNGPFRNMVRSQLAVVSHHGKPGVLHVLHGRGGGTEKYVQDLMSATSDDFRHYLLRILHDSWRLTDAAGVAPANYDFPRQAGDANGGFLGSLCSWLRIDLVHVHSLVGSGDDLLEILDEAALPYCYSVHDMYLPCPTVYLIDSRGEYCEATTDHAACRQCLSKFSALEDTDVERWRRRYRGFLDKASKVFAPSAWARDTLTKYYPGVSVTVAPPGPGFRDTEPMREVTNGVQLPDDDCRHVGILGAIGPEKGARHLETLAGRIRDRSLPLRLVLVGYTDRDNRHQSDDNVLTIHGPYRPEEIAALFDYYRIALVVFPTVWPETFSYTLSEGWMAGRPALVPPRGALQERVLATGAGWIMDGWPNTDAILDQLMALTAPGNREELARRAQLAKSASGDGRDATELMRKSYGDMLASTTRRTEHVISRLQIHDAACRALGMEPPRQPAGSATTGAVQGDAKRGRLFRLFRR